MNKNDQQLFNIRINYSKARLSKADVKDNPLEQFRLWFDEALTSKVREVNAMTLSTVNTKGKASSRIVLLKKVDDYGFQFFTNYLSAKGRELDKNPHCSLVFFWPELERQVRVQGEAVKVNDADSDNYFLSRPRDSRIGAWASPQSEEISNRQELENKALEAARRFKDKEISRPPFWGGYRVNPEMVEFWQGRPGRLHDRIQYRKTQDKWKIVRLAP